MARMTLRHRRALCYAARMAQIGALIAIGAAFGLSGGLP